MDCSPSDSSVHGILQARMLEWVAMPFSRGSSRPRDLTHISYVSCIGRQVLYHKCHLGVTWKFLSCVQLFVTPWTIGVVSLSLIQRIFPTQGSNPALPHCRQILYQLSHQGSPRILEWAAYPFSSGSSQPRNRTGVSCTAGGFCTSWAIREATWEAPYKWNHTIFIFLWLIDFT